MTRDSVVEAARHIVDRGRFAKELAQLVAHPTDSTADGALPHLWAYLDTEIAPRLTAMGMEISRHDNPVPGAAPLMIGRRVESPDVPTVLIYGHGDVVPGMEGRRAGAVNPRP